MDIKELVEWIINVWYNGTPPEGFCVENDPGLLFAEEEMVKIAFEKEDEGGNSNLLSHFLSNQSDKK